MKARLILDEINFRNGIALVQEIEKSMRGKLPCWQMLVDIHLRHLVLLLSRAYEGYLRKHDEASVRMQSGIAFLEKNFKQSIELDQFAAKAGMSPRTFYRLFKRAVGQSPLAYLIGLRIQYACNALRNTDIPITQIAFDSGFSDSNYFAREFRKIVCESPTAYRARWAN